MIDSWEESQSKSKYRLWAIPVSVLVIAAIGSLLYLNNSGSSDTGDNKNSSINKKVKDASDETFSVSDSEVLNKDVPDSLSEKVAKSVAVTNIKCGLSGKASSEILISLRLFYKDKKDEKEILFKRDEIKFTIQKIMMKKKLEDINVDLLRNELKNEIDNLLGTVKLDDLEFTDFKPVELL